MAKPTTSKAAAAPGTTATATAKPLHIFKAGKHTAMSGARLAFSESDLVASAAAYDPELHEAPLVIGHPRHDMPAYGWVKSVSFSDGDIDHDPGMYALPAQVNADFADMVAAGAFKKISASFYPPNSPSNPVPGVYYLRHVGFLGAQPPAIKGLAQVAFADNNEYVTFSEWDDVTNAGLWRGLRDWVLAKFGQDEADKALPGYRIESLEQGAQQGLAEARSTASTESQPSVAPAFSEGAIAPTPADAAPAATVEQSAQSGQTTTTPTPEDTVTPEEKAAIEAENNRLRAELAAHKANQVHAANMAFAENLVSQGRLLPAHTGLIAATLDHFATQDSVVEFGEGEAKAPLAEQLKAMLSAAPKVVAFGEHATQATAAQAGAEADDDIQFAENTDPARLAQHKAVKAHMAQHKVDYATAARAVIR
jgi:hypothetical protein